MKDVSKRVKNIDLTGRVLSCPVQGKMSSFQLVDELGAGEPYARLPYKLIDSEGFKYSGYLDSTGTGKVTNHFAGPVVLIMDEEYRGVRKVYKHLQTRPHYPLKITELQVRAEQTRYANKNGSRTKHNPVEGLPNTGYYQVEVRHLVEHMSHLPPEVECHYLPCKGARQVMGKHGLRGVCIPGSQHSILQVRPLRALRPVFSIDPKFCALNLYQLALMATLSYCPFGQEPDQHPIEEPRVTFPRVPSSGNWFADALAKFQEIWRVDAGQTQAYYPLYEDVAYSKRFEIVPFDPVLYPLNNPQMGPNQESPAKIHFLDDRGHVVDTDTQAFATPSDEIILIAVRGTSEIVPDGLRDLDAIQVPFKQGDGAVHRGFYGAANKAYVFAMDYLERFYSGQKLLICGHSLGGAIALLLSEMLRRRSEGYDILLYTYGAPRAGDATFVNEAEPLVHHRMVNHNDPVPSVPMPWLKLKPAEFPRGSVIRFHNVAAQFSAYVANVVNWDGDPYAHHGQLQHFMPVDFGAGEVSHMLWMPSCETLTDHAACTLALQHAEGLPVRDGLARQLKDAANHFMTTGYVHCSWAALRRWQEALAARRMRVTSRELEWVDEMLARIEEQVKERRSWLTRSEHPYVRVTQSEISALLREASKVKMTRDRLWWMSLEPLLPADVYGDHAADPERLAEYVERWQAHPENTRAEQLAMAPTGLSNAELNASIGIHVIGAPSTGDVLGLG